MIFEYAAAMTSTVSAVRRARKTARYWWSPRFLNASSGPYALEESPSAPRPTQARNAASERLWKSCGSSRFFGPPRSTRFTFCHRERGAEGMSGAGGGLLGCGAGEGPVSIWGRFPTTPSSARRLLDQPRQRLCEQNAVVQGVCDLVALDSSLP